jgi:hypothetical protein
MRAVPVNETTRAGGRPRSERAVVNKWGEWLEGCGMPPVKVAEKLTARLVKIGAREREKPVSASTVYNIRNSYFIPGRSLASAIAELTDGEIPVEYWDTVEVRKPPPKRKRGRHAPRVT